MKSLLALFYTTAALCTFSCSAGTGGPGSPSTVRNDIPPISGDVPPISGDRPPSSGGDIPPSSADIPPTSGVPRPGERPAAALVCGGKYRCLISQSDTETITIDCKKFLPNGKIVNQGIVVGSYAVSDDGSFIASETEKNGSALNYTCTPAL
jgi:hypothetical protein